MTTKKISRQIFLADNDACELLQNKTQHTVFNTSQRGKETQVKQSMNLFTCSGQSVVYLLKLNNLLIESNNLLALKKKKDMN